MAPEELSPDSKKDKKGKKKGKKKAKAKKTQKKQTSEKGQAMLRAALEDGSVDEEEAREIFQRFDRDGSQELSLKELTTVVVSILTQLKKKLIAAGAKPTEPAAPRCAIRISRPTGRPAKPSFWAHLASLPMRLKSVKSRPYESTKPE